MTGLVAVLWVVYLTECFVRWRPGDWIFRSALWGAPRGVSEPDFALLDGRFCFVWTSLLPGAVVYRFAGEDTNRRRSQVDLDRVRHRSRWLRICSTTLSALVMIVLPVLIWTERFVPLLPLFVGAFVAVWAATLAASLLTHRRVYGVAAPMESWLVLALSPVSLMRAPVSITLDASSGTHPAIAADALCDTSEFLRIARLWHFDAPELRADLERLAAKRGHAQALTAPPADIDAGVTFFCRRCHATYLSAASRCVDCDEVELTPLAGT
jgi:hypothetical protein